MQRQPATWRERWSALDQQGSFYAAAVVLLVVACLTLVSWLAWRTIEPRWTSPGYPSYIGYGKNVEHAALLFSGLAAVLICLGLPKRWIRLSWAWLLLIPALVVAYRYCSVDTQWLPPVLIVFNAAYFAWFYRRDAAAPSGPLREPWPKGVSIGLFALTGLYVCQQVLWPKTVSMFDQGEVILSAHDWLAGGKPYETMFWPHGLHDTGLTALFMSLTGNRGLGADVLAKTTIHLCGLVAVLLICRNVLRRWADAVVVSGLIAACYPSMLFWLGNALFVVLAWQLLARREDPLATISAGALLAWSYLWRFDYGVFGLAAAIGGIALLPFYRAFCNQGGWRVVFDRDCLAAAAKRLALLAVGMAGCWTVTWLTLGIPNTTVFYMTLWELPKHHADNTGFPLLLPLAGFEQYPEPLHRLARWITVGTILFATTLAVFLLIKIRDKRLAVAAAEDRFCLMMSLFCLLTIKSLLDRCDIGHAVPVFAVWCLLFVFDLAARCTWRWPALFRLSVLSVVTIVIVGGGFFQMLLPGSRRSVFLREGLATVWLHRPQLQVRQALNVLAQCLTPTSRFEEMLEPTAFEDKPLFTEELRQLRHVLDEHAIGPRGLLAAHSAPLLYPLVDRQCPTRYYMLGWAMNERMQQEAIADLKRSQVQAVLRLNGYGVTIPNYDVPDEHRIPLIHDYINQQIADWPSYNTRFGVLFVNARVPGDYGRLTRDAAGESIQLAQRSVRVVKDGLIGYVDHFEATPQHVLFNGWTADTTQGKSAEKLLVFLDGQCVFAGRPHATRPDVVLAFNNPQLLPSGFDLRLSRSMVPAGSEGHLRVFSVLEDRAAELSLPQPAVAVAETPNNPPRG